VGEIVGIILGLFILFLISLYLFKKYKKNSIEKDLEELSKLL
jgi:hypothetical protein